VKDAKNEDAIRAKLERSFMLIKLPVGKYNIGTAFSGEILHQQFEIKEDRSVNVTSLWSNNSDMKNNYFV